MEALEGLRARVAGFPGYDTDADRRRSDELVRSYLGEAIAELPPAEQLRERIDALLLRVGFASQGLFAPHADAMVNHSGDAAVIDADAVIVELADTAPTVPGDGLAAYLDKLNEALDRRDAAMRASAVRT